VRQPRQSNGDLAVNPQALGALTEIAECARKLIALYAERIRTEDGYQVIDPRTIANAFQKLAAKAAEDPRGIINEQIAFWVDMMQLWQRTTTRMLLGIPVEPVITPAADDKRFKSEIWVENPLFDFMKQCYLLLSQHIQSAVRGVEGIDQHASRKAQFYTRQLIDALSPTNFAATNPDVLKATVESRGENLIRGLKHLLEDLERGQGRLSLKMSDLSAFKFGENIAVSPGKVIFQNDLMQLIQYEPSTDMVYRRPLLIVPPWISKFYILDLKPKNSFIKWCVDQGHTIFMISWVNPGAELARKGFADYLLEGPLAALGAIKRATGQDEANVLGYCIGGTLAAITLAYMAAKKDRRVKSATLFASLLDFSDVGDISVFIDEEQLKLLDDHMNRLGYLDGRHMAEAFNLLRDNDLIWFFVVNNYLLGREPIAFDLLYWNSDSTRMPAAMHGFYLRSMYHQNRLKEPGGITLADVPIDLPRRTSCRRARIISRRGDRRMPEHGCCPVPTGSCWAHPGTSPASSTRPPRRSTGTGPTKRCRTIPRLGSVAPTSRKDRGGKTGRAGLPTMRARRCRRASPGIANSLRSKTRRARM
jgi:polyhydroxyalkanoate synthase subunit PhaC